MFRRWVGALVGLVLMGMAGPAGAVLLSYDEATDGDILCCSQQLTLDKGANTVVGTTSGDGTGLGLDFDIFNVTLPGSTTLVSIDLILTSDPAGDGSFPNIFNWIIDGNFFSIDVSAGVAFAIPIGAFEPVATFIGLNSLPSLMITDYIITLNVVPEPATFAIFGIGLAGLGFIGWRRRRKAAA